MKKGAKNNTKNGAKKPGGLNPVKNMKIRTKTVIPMVALIIMVMVTGATSVINTKSIMEASDEINNVHFANVYNLEELNYNFECLQRIAYAHCVSTDDTTKRTLEEEISTISAENEELIATLSESLDEDAMDSFATFQKNYEGFMTYFSKAIQYSADGKTAEAAQVANTSIKELGTKISGELDEMVLMSQIAMQEKVAEQRATYSLGTSEAIGISSLASIVGLVVFIVILVEVVTPIKKTSAKLNQIISDIERGQGDLTARVPVRGRDEIGQLASGINGFIESLQGIMIRISNNSNRLEEIVGTVSNSVHTANESSVDISAVMEELSASMEEVSSTVTSINSSANDVKGNVVKLADASDELLSYATEMRTRASELESNAVSNKQSASAMIESILSTLRQAIEDSKSVDRVNDLTGEILSISSQTNLLALNASIEAARAGEAGRGFAVVAEEIRQLADSSREAANNIQTINNMVTIAVKALIKNSNELVDYINDTILPDYDSFVDSGKQYNDDAAHVNEVVEKFNTMAAEISSLIQYITEAIDGISTAVEESANGVSTAALNTGELVKDINQITTEMESNSEVAGELKGESATFVNL